MLNFWKKASQKIDLPKETTRPVNCNSLADEIELIEKTSNESFPTYSRLSKTLKEILNDNEAANFFTQYLDVLHATPLIKFLQDVNNPVTKNIDQYITNGNVMNHVCDLRKYCGQKCDCENKTVCVCPIVVPSEVGNHVKIIESDDWENKCDVPEHVANALKVYRKYFSYNAPFRILLTSDILQRQLEKIFSGIEENIFEEIQDIILRALEKEYYNEYLRSEFHCKYQMNLLTSNQVLISDILYNDTALFYLMEFLEQENFRCLLEFWLAAGNFLEQYQSTDHPYDPQQAQQDAMVLYDKYFSLQASHPLNLGDRVRFKIEENICHEHGGPPPTCFEHARHLIVHLLDRKFLHPFLHSQLYLKYLSELISTVHASPITRGTGGSDCSSELSLSATNTLLVSSSSSGKPLKPWDGTSSTSAITIDTRQLYDPDALWKSQRKTGLNFGRVNALGRFETDLEPEPDRKSKIETRITKAMKKLVNLEEEQSKEEMAWQVAEMIIKDVTSLTMPESRSSSSN